MTPELRYLLLTAILLALMWVPYVVGLVKTMGLLTPEEYRHLRDASNAPSWVKRADRAHKNLAEQFPAFAAVVVVAHLAGVSTTLTVAASAVYFWSRIVHAAIFIGGFSRLMARTVVFAVSVTAILVIAIEVIRHT